MTLHILADALWYGSLALIVLGASYTLGRQFLSEQAYRRRVQERLERLGRERR